jgi:hypothetical protein
VNAPSVALVDALQAVLRGEEAGLDRWSPTEVVDAAAWHGVTPLLAECRSAGGELAVVLQRSRALAAALEGLRQREMVAVLDALAARGVRVLLVKGSALAYTVYREPVLRPRFDTDIFIRRDDRTTVAEVMTALGYARPHQVTGDLVMHQLDYLRKDTAGIWHVFDFHWKLSNRHAVADTLSFDEVDATSEEIKELGPHARGPSPVHALVIGCVHRVAHHSADERLIWLYDIHLLVEQLSASDVDAFVALARERSVTLICADGLRAAERALGTSLPAGLIGRLTPAGAVAAAEPSAALLTHEPSLARELLSDFKAVGWSQRVRLVREHAFPPAHYMSATYMVSSRAWLPALCTHRLVRGAWRLLRGATR